MSNRVVKFEIGQTVKLKIGSPNMTVLSINTIRNVTSNFKGFTEDFTGNYTCQWFVDDKYQEATFAEESLELA